MSAKIQSKLSFKGVEFTNVHFDSQKFYDGKAPIKVDILPKIFYDSSNKDSFKIVMVTDISSENFFSLKINALGVFMLNDPNRELPEEQRTFLINLNSPAIMFPYVRAFVASLTGNVGTILPRLTLPPQFFDSKLEEIDIDDSVEDISN